MAKIQSDEDKKYMRIMDELGNYKFVDLQRAVIIRGMDFGDVIKSDHGGLSDFFIRAYDEPKDKSRIQKFEEYVDKILESRGYKEDDPVRKFKKFSSLEVENVEVAKIKKEKVIKPKAIPKVKNTELNIISGTKKELTYKLAKSLHTKYGDKYNLKELVGKFSSQLLTKVQQSFPEANESSVKVWMSRCLKSLI